MSYSTGIVIYDGAEPGDLADAYRAFGAARDPAGGGPLFDVHTIGRTKEFVTLIGGLQVMPDHIYPDGRVYDLIIVPGGPGAERAIGHLRMVQWLGRAGRVARLIGAGGNGALLLQAAGLLPAAAAHVATPARVGPQGPQRVGKVICAPAGQGMALALAAVDQLCGSKAAQAAGRSLGLGQ
jgi:transcriptional regulator GlxA family with amidase domain